MSEEPRYYIYSSTINLIKKSLSGRGLGNFSGLPGYPHNIILEITLPGGIISLFILFILLFYYLKVFLQTIKIKNVYIVLAALSVFYFLTWNISFDLSASYIPFTSIALLFSSTKSRRNIKNII